MKLCFWDAQAMIIILLFGYYGDSLVCTIFLNGYSATRTRLCVTVNESFTGFNPPSTLQSIWIYLGYGGGWEFNVRLYTQLWIVKLTWNPGCEVCSCVRARWHSPLWNASLQWRQNTNWKQNIQITLTSTSPPPSFPPSLNPSIHPSFSLSPHIHHSPVGTALF